VRRQPIEPEDCLRSLTAEVIAAIESVSAHGKLVIVRLYGHPWGMGEYWPMITPCFAVQATDDEGEAAWADIGLPGRTN
jgi:hypothetical protein